MRLVTQSCLNMYFNIIGYLDIRILLLGPALKADGVLNSTRFLFFLSFFLFCRCRKSALLRHWLVFALYAEAVKYASFSAN